MQRCQIVQKLYLSEIMTFYGIDVAGDTMKAQQTHFAQNSTPS